MESSNQKKMTIQKDTCSHAGVTESITSEKSLRAAQSYTCNRSGLETVLLNKLPRPGRNKTAR